MNHISQVKGLDWIAMRNWNTSSVLSMWITHPIYKLFNKLYNEVVNYVKHNNCLNYIKSIVKLKIRNEIIMTLWNISCILMTWIIYLVSYKNCKSILSVWNISYILNGWNINLLKIITIVITWNILKYWYSEL